MSAQYGKKLRERFENIDRQGIRLDRDDLLMLLAFIPVKETREYEDGESLHPKHEAFFEAVENFLDRKKRFLEKTSDPDRFLDFAQCLLTLAYGHERGKRFLVKLRTFLRTVGKPPEWARKRREPEEFRGDIIYVLYVDLFAELFSGLSTRLDYFEELGVNVLHLLPFLDHTGIDAGLDQRDRYKIHEKLGGDIQFYNFARSLADRNLTIIMDLIINHRSWKCKEFQDETNPQRGKVPESYFIWSKDVEWRRGNRDYDPKPDIPPPCLAPPSSTKPRAMFEGFVVPRFEVRGDDEAERDDEAEKIRLGQPKIKGTWWWNEARRDWYYHSFYPQQPDVNYDNPAVLIGDLKFLRDWLDGEYNWLDGEDTREPIEQRVVSYVRLDAIPFLFKREKRDITRAVRDAFHEDIGRVVKDAFPHEIIDGAVRGAIPHEAIAGAVKDAFPHEDIDPAAVRDAIPHEAISRAVRDAISYEAIAGAVKGEFPDEDIDPAAVRDEIPLEDDARKAVKAAISHDHIACAVKAAISHEDTARAVRDALREDIAGVVIDAIPHERIAREVIDAIPHEAIAHAVINAFLYGKVGRVYDKYALMPGAQAVELPQVHLLVRLISAFVEHRYGRWVGILSESNAPIEKWKRYFGEGTGAKLNYQFHRMQGLWASLAWESRIPLMRALSVTFDSPRRCAGVTFGRVHDELTVDNADDEVMKKALEELASMTNKVVPKIGDSQHQAFSDYPLQDPDRPYGFYNESIAARMETLLRALPKNLEKTPNEDLVEKYRLMMQLLMALDDIPLIYMGDEWGEPVNWSHLAEQPGRDMRNVHRAIEDRYLPLRLTRKQLDGSDLDKLAWKIHSITRDAIHARRESLVMRHGTLDLLTDPEDVEDVLAFTRTLGEDRVLVVCNLGRQPRTVEVCPDQARTAARDLLIREPFINARRAYAVTLDLEPRQCRWLHLSRLD